MEPSLTPPPAQQRTQRIIPIRRSYNKWVADETLEDYALRFTPRSFRKWSEMRVANTAFGASSFLVLEAVGATMLVQAGFLNAFWAILATGLIIFLLGLPISIVAARHGLDMDLLTRGAGFGYIGSTITSLIYASFTFIFFALEAAIMAYALELAFGIPPVWGYLICAVVVIPLVTYGVTAISRLQAWTQPLWLLLLILPYAFIFAEEPQAFANLWHYGGERGGNGSFDPQLFGAALTVGIALVTQMGEQVDYLRFMPEKTAANRGRWWAGVILGGPGWVLPGTLKMLGGTLLAWLALRNAIPVEKAVDPNQMYLIGFSHVFDNTTLAIAATALFVVVSQLKINVTNAYAGSLAWSNFFSRLTHSHPGRVVWVVFNTAIALMLMELDVFAALGQVLGLYSNIAISWMAAVVADLVINKPLGLSPRGMEFKRSNLYDINPVGVGAMGVASLLAIATFTGVFGAALQPYASFVALGAAFILSPLIAIITRGRYYLTREAGSNITHGGRCAICERDYEAEDLTHCPAYQGNICSLCCSLDARCHDLCKPEATLSSQWHAVLRRLLPRAVQPYIDTGLGHYLLLMFGITSIIALVLGILYTHELLSLAESGPQVIARLQDSFVKLFAALVLLSGVIAWWMVLTQQSRHVAQEESNRQTELLLQEIESHQRTDAALQQAKQSADQANQAKSRYITAISHELRTPLNSILGYAQILAADEDIPENRRQAVTIIRKSGDHLLSVIEGTLDIARIEGGKLKLDVRALDFPELLQQIVGMFELQARNKGLSFEYRPVGRSVPAIVRADERRLRQILINVLGNAVKFTMRGSVTFSVECRREMAIFEIRDTGPGIPAADMERIFEPFVRGSTVQAGGSGVGLTIARMLTDLMGGEMQVSSTLGEGTLFRIRLFLPQVHSTQAGVELPKRNRIGYIGARRRLLVVDNEKDDRDLLQNVLEPLGFIVEQAADGYECLATVPRFMPHLIFMDLGMPGIDGYETIRRLRQVGIPGVEVAILSANAFDKGLDNDVGIGAEDFIVKPLQVNALLDWLGRKLDLEWITAGTPPAPAATAPAAPPPLVPPDACHLTALDDLIDLGYLRGILAKLAEIEALDARHTEFVRVLRELARQFQFDAMKEILSQTRHASH
ncbi:MAG: response regulator [Betaproteobacteria bacterium]|nr:response regulator [Betaproteobacteria bacterium]